MVTRMVLQHILQYINYIDIAYRLHIRQPFRPRTSRARVLFFNDVYCRPATSAHELWPRRSTFRHGAPVSKK